MVRYPLYIDLDIDDLIKGYIYLMKYKLVNEVDISVYNKILQEKLYLSIDSNADELDLNSNNDNKSDFIDYTSSEHTDSS